MATLRKGRSRVEPVANDVVSKSSPDGIDHAPEESLAGFVLTAAGTPRPTAPHQSAA